MALKTHSFSYSEFNDESELADNDRSLISSAKRIARQAYAPYSQFNVGAAIRLKNGDIITGNNQENMAFPSGLCAERTALFYAKSQFPDQDIQEIAIAAYSDDFALNNAISPCGACRQALLEYEINQDSPIKVIMSNFDASHILMVDAIRDLLPIGFKEVKLKKNS